MHPGCAPGTTPCSQTLLRTQISYDPQSPVRFSKSHLLARASLGTVSTQTIMPGEPEVLSKTMSVCLNQAGVESSVPFPSCVVLEEGLYLSSLIPGQAISGFRMQDFWGCPDSGLGLSAQKDRCA